MSKEISEMLSIYNRAYKDIRKKLIKSFLSIIQGAIDSFANASGLKDDIKTILEFSLQGKSQQELDQELHRLACSRWQRNNIIRCYNVSQNRWADGFDF